MVDSNNILIICRDIKSVKRLRHFSHKSQNRYILASDNSRVQELAKEYSWIDGICWIEQMESFYCVANDVIHLTKVVNDWLKTLADDKKGFPEELLFFTRHVEGGMTTQRIQDSLLLIRSYLFLIDTHKITNILLISQSDMAWEDEVLIETARSRDVVVQLLGRYAFSALIKKVKFCFEIYARAMYYAVNVLRIKLYNRCKFKNDRTGDKEIVFQLCSSAYKHVGDILPLMKALRGKGYNAVAICWLSNEKYSNNSGSDQIRKEGFIAEDLEKWCSFSDIWKSIFGVFWTWKKAKGKKHGFVFHKELNYHSVGIGNLLWPSVKFFIVSELPQSYRLRQALKKYFKVHKPVAVKLWGSISLREGFLAWKSLPVEKPLIFDYWLGAAIEWPYKVVDSPVDIFFVAGNYHKKIIKKILDFPHEKVRITGQARYEQLIDFKKNNTPSQSRSYLKIPNKFSTYIFYDSGMILRGFMSRQEQARTLNALLKFARSYQTSALLIKPHPSDKGVGIISAIASYALENVFLIDSKMLPYHGINASDLLITKYSTLGIEAMLFNILLKCCILDREKKFNIYTDIFSPFYSIEDLSNWLESFVRSNKFKIECVRNQKRASKSFLHQYFDNLDSTIPSVNQANILVDLIE